MKLQDYSSEKIKRERPYAIAIGALGALGGSALTAKAGDAIGVGRNSRAALLGLAGGGLIGGSLGLAHKYRLRRKRKLRDKKNLGDWLISTD